jgi:hypothetical protein
METRPLKKNDGRAYLGLLGLFALAAFVVLPLAIAFGADISPGYTFTSGERNVTHTKLNSSAAGTINTSFYSGKSSAGSDPNTAFTFLLHDTSLDVFKKTTLAVGVFDHAGLLASRTAKTAPVLADALMIEDSAAASAYKRMTATNFLFGGTSTTAPTNETTFPALRGGALGAITLSNIVGGLTAHLLPTNGDAILVLTENGGRAVKTLSLAQMITGATYATTNAGTNSSLIWDGQLRAIMETNRTFGLAQSSAPATNDWLQMLVAGSLRKVILNDLRLPLGYQNIVQSTYTGTTNIVCVGNWSNVTTIGTSTLSNAITPRASSSKILVRLVLHGCGAGNNQPGFARVLRDGSAIGVGDTDGSNRTEAGTILPNSTDPETTVWEWLDSPATTSAVGYNVQVTATASTTVYINRTSNDTDNANHGRLVSTLTLTEILQ